MALLPHLFRTEYGKIVAVLVRTLGTARVSEAEDLVSDTFLLASETWGLKGVPQNPTGWLYTVAKNKAKDLQRRKGLFKTKIQPALSRAAPTTEVPEFDFSPQGFQDSQLRMIFALCHPALNTETQVALCLRILGGFGIEEISSAFLTNKATINKRLSRGKARLREVLPQLELPQPTQLVTRLDAVLTTIYLLFNEGYHATSTPTTFRRDLCVDAIRLAILLTNNERTDLPRVSALLALMCFQASRFEARVDAEGALIIYTDQDRALWDQQLIKQGQHFLAKATAQGETGRYQLEAAIAFLHTQHEEAPDKWTNILSLYNRLLMKAYSPVAALNRTYAYAQVFGPAAALREAKKIGLTGHLGYHLLIAELSKELGDQPTAQAHYALALNLTKNPAVLRLIEQKLRKE